MGEGIRSLSQLVGELDLLVIMLKEFVPPLGIHRALDFVDD